MTLARHVRVMAGRRPLLTLALSVLTGKAGPFIRFAAALGFAIGIDD